MRLITTQSQLEKEFNRLSSKYENYYWATAWAGINSRPFDNLVKNEGKIKQIVVGIHFYQTHPDFIETFINNKKVRYILQPEGTFHPKIYLFTNDADNWELLVGSGNFTKSAFNVNKEATILLSQNDTGSKDIYEDAIEFINQLWGEGKTFIGIDLDRYRITWKNHRPKIRSLSGIYGSLNKKSIPIHEVAIINKDWEEFISQVKSETAHGVKKRLRVLEIASELFSRVHHFNELLDEERKFIAGMPNKLNVNGAEEWGYFGSMKGAGIYKSKINLNDNNISKALDQIPISGQITRKHYDSFIKYFQQSFLGTRLEMANNLATATRLLAMKRPDVFVCYDSENRTNLSHDFGIVQKGMNYDRYWDDIIERIYDSEWWLNPAPIDDIEVKISNARAAFLDSLYYEEPL
jgi:predicted metallo-beta-lactamase superfamily hydrolase